MLAALFVNFGSNENFRHLDHCSDDSCASKVMQVLLNKEAEYDLQALLAIEPAVKLYDGKKYNALLKSFSASATK